METLSEIINRIENRENVKIKVTDEKDGGMKFEIKEIDGKDISIERNDEVGSMILQEIFISRNRGLDVNKDDEQVLELYSVSRNEPNLRYYQALHNFLEQRSEEDNKSIFLKAVESCKVFDMSNSVANILYLTKCKDTLKRPFNNMFLNCRIKLKDNFYYGFWITKFYGGRDCIITLSPQKQKVGFTLVPKTFDLLDNTGKNDHYTEKGERKNIINFYNAFLMFLNEPEVVFKDVLRTDANLLRRLKNGKTPLPPTNTKIELTGKLLVYLEKIESYQNIQYTHKFWVRGHYMSLWKKDKYKKLYSLAEYELKEKGYYLRESIIRVWKKPYIKGEGLLINKNYDLNKAECSISTKDTKNGGDAK